MITAQNRSVLLRQSQLDHSEAVDQAYEEFCRRQEKGEVIDPKTFCAQHPGMESSLAKLLSAHAFLEKNLDLFGDEETIAWPRPGETFVGFHIKGELGHGAFARVFQAIEPALGNRQVVLKISRHGSAEAATLGRLDHPNIVPVYSVKEDATTALTVVCMPYLGHATMADVQDYLEWKPKLGASASVLLQAAKENDVAALPARGFPARGSYQDAVRWWALHLADGLAFIHERGICHRDLKPSNVLIRPDGTPMLLDFNLSSDRDLPDTRLGGTLPYMAPEQLLATDRANAPRPDLLDARSDLFSLGVILYEMLTGHNPFGPVPENLPAENVRKFLLEQQKKGCQPLRQVLPGIDPTLAKVVESCLAFQPKDRPAQARMIVQTLRQSMKPLRRLTSWTSRHPRATVAACVLFLGSVAAAGTALANREPESVRHYRYGLAAYQRQDYQSALQHLSQVLQSEPENAQALFARGRSYQKLATSLGGSKGASLYSNALGDYRLAMDLSPDGRIQACRAYCNGCAGQIHAAIAQYGKALKMGFQTPELLNNLGFCYMRIGEHEKAEDVLHQALQMNPTLTPAHHNLGLVYIQVAQMRMDMPNQSLNLLQTLRLAQTHLTEAMRLGPVSSELALLSAKATAYAARFDETQIKDVLPLLEKAVELGTPPKSFLEIPAFRAFRGNPQFQALAQRPLPANPVPKASYVLDPVND